MRETNIGFLEISPESPTYLTPLCLSARTPTLRAMATSTGDTDTKQIVDEFLMSVRGSTEETRMELAHNWLDRVLIQLPFSVLMTSFKTKLIMWGYLKGHYPYIMKAEYFLGRTDSA